MAARARAGGPKDARGAGLRTVAAGVAVGAGSSFRSWSRWRCGGVSNSPRWWSAMAERAGLLLTWQVLLVPGACGPATCVVIIAAGVGRAAGGGSRDLVFGFQPHAARRTTAAGQLHWCCYGGRRGVPFSKMPLCSAREG